MLGYLQIMKQAFYGLPYEIILLLFIFIIFGIIYFHLLGSIRRRKEILINDIKGKMKRYERSIRDVKEEKENTMRIPQDQRISFQKFLELLITESNEIPEKKGVNNILEMVRSIQADINRYLKKPQIKEIISDISNFLAGTREHLKGREAYRQVTKTYRQVTKKLDLLLEDLNNLDISEISDISSIKRDVDSLKQYISPQMSFYSVLSQFTEDEIAYIYRYLSFKKRQNELNALGSGELEKFKNEIDLDLATYEPTPKNRDNYK